MDDQNEGIDAQPEAAAASMTPADTNARREFIKKLGKAALVPAVVVGIAAASTSALAGSY